MANQDWEKWGDEIRRTVQNAVDSQDYEKLNQTITNTINSAIDSAAQGFRTMGDVIDKTARSGRPRGRDRRRDNRYNRRNQGPDFGFGQGFQGGPWNSGPGQNGPWQGPFPGNVKPVSQPYRTQPPQSPYFKNMTSKKAAAVALTACGYSIGAVLFFIFILFILGWFLTDGLTVSFIVASIMFGVLIGGFGIMAGVGTSMLGRIRRFRTYIRELQGKEYCEIKELSQRLDKPVKYIVKDLESMIRRGWFRQGHLDKQKTCLMVSHGAYDQYIDLMQQTEQQKQEEEARRQQEARKQQDNPGLSPEIQEVIREGDAYIRKIHECNDAIPGEEISAKISRMEMLVDKIFDRVEQNPETVDDIRRLMEYYLPTTVKLLEAYEDLDAQPVQGDNIISAKREIEKTLDTLNVAFEKLLDSLFQDTAWDVASDVSVLKTMLAQEGLTEDGLTGKKDSTR